MCGDGEGEVWNNTLIILMYSLLCNMDNRLTRLDDHGEFAHPYTAIQRSINVSQTTRDGSPIQDYNDYDKASGQYFDQLSLYSTIIHSFGPSKFVDFFYTYNLNPAYCANKRADFVYRMGLVDHVNMLPWINEFYHGNISESDYTAEQWNFLQTLPTFYPIAFRWANGVDGNETARKYEVDGKTSTVFDLSGDNIICPKSFTVDGVSSAEHGNVSYDATEKQVTYTPPTDVTEFDGFDIYVTTEGGRRVTLNVRFALLYRSSYTEVWDITELGGKPTVQNALDYIEQHDLTPYSTQSSGVAGTTFTRDKIEYLHLRFKFLAQTDGVYKFYIRADDASQVDFYKDGFNEQSLKTLSTSKDSSKYTDNGEFEYEMKAGDMLYVDGKLVNWGGLGYISVGVKFPDTDTIVEIPQENLVSPFVTSEELAQADSFEGWQPRFVDSIKNTVIDHKSEKDGWQVIKYPAGQPNDGNSADCMVDGNEDNFFHVQYSGANVPQYPHEFVFDMGVEQTVNYFEILRRGIGNERIYEMKLYGAQDGSVDEHGNELTDGAFKELFNGNVSNSNDRRYRVRFKDQSLRYFKLVVVRTQNVTVINEVYAGQEAQLSQTIKPSNYQKANDGFEENSANGKLSTETVGAFYEFEFLGTGFDIFADTSPDYGAAKVTVDGEQSGVIDLNVNAAFNKCVYKWSDTKAAQHTVRIETTSAGKFNISFINVNYGTPVGKDDYPALKKADGTEDYGNESVNRIFSRDWRTVVKDYKTLTSIRFVKSAPEGYEDTFERMDTFIRIYRNAQNYSELAFVYPGGIVSPSDCGSLFAGCAALEEIVLDNFDTTSMQGAVSMFNGCTSLRYVNAGKLNTENALWLGKMFANCSILTTVDIGGATIADGANIFGMFDGCVELDQIILPSNIGQNVYGELPGVYLDTTAERYVRSLTAANAGHTLKLHANHTAGTQHQKIEPTCTQTGMSEYYDCAECGFACVGGEYRTESSLVLQALGHEPVPYLDYELPTCSHPGHDIGLMCDRCGEVLYQGDEIPALPHTEEVTEGKAPTCTQKGLSDGSHCSVCGETLIEQQELAALEHTPEVLRGKAATATEKGLTDGLRCSVCGEILQAQSEIPALGTADTDNLNMTAIILGTLGGALLLSALAVTVIVLVRRRKN